MKQSRRDIVKAIAEKICGNNLDVQLISREIAAYVLDERRSGELESLLRDVMRYRATHGIVEVVAYSAFPISENVRGDIETEVRRAYPDVTTVIISERHDSSIIAGVRLEFADSQLDMTVQAKLNKLKQLTGAGKER